MPDPQFTKPGTGYRAPAYTGTLVDARDIYSAGPPAMLRELAHFLDQLGVSKERQHMDVFGV